MHLEKYHSKEENVKQAIYWMDENSPKLDSIPKLNIHKVYSNGDESLNTSHIGAKDTAGDSDKNVDNDPTYKLPNYTIKNSEPQFKLTDTAEDDCRSIDKDPIFEVHTVSSDGKTTDYSYIKLNATECDPKDDKNPYKRKTYSIRFQSGEIYKGSCFRRFRKYYPRFSGAKFMRSNLCAAKSISYDMFGNVVKAIYDFAEKGKPYCEFNNNHEDFIYDVSKKAGIPGYTSTFSSFFGLFRHNLYKRQFRNMVDKESGKESYFDYFSEDGPSDKKYGEYNKRIEELANRNNADFNVDITVGDYFKLHKYLFGKNRDDLLLDICLDLFDLIFRKGKIGVTGNKYNYLSIESRKKILNSVYETLLEDLPWNCIYYMNDKLGIYVDDCMQNEDYDKIMAAKSLQHNILLPFIEKERYKILMRKNQMEDEKYITHEISNTTTYIMDSDINKEYKDISLNDEKYKDSEVIRNIEFDDSVKYERLFPYGEPKISDIRQTNIGDCYLLASLISMVSTKEGREFIKKVVQDNHDGFVTVSFYGANRKIIIEKTVPKGISTESALWVQMIEKAYAASGRLGEKVINGYDSIIGGFPNKFILRISDKEVEKKSIVDILGDVKKFKIRSVNGSDRIIDISEEPIRYLSKLTQTEDYTLYQLDVWKKVIEGLERNRNVVFSTNIENQCMFVHHTYVIIGCEKIGSHYFFKVINPWDNRYGLKYFNIENMTSKMVFEYYFYESKDGAFLLELSHFIDLTGRLFII